MKIGIAWPDWRNPKVQDLSSDARNKFLYSYHVKRPKFTLVPYFCISFYSSYQNKQERFGKYFCSHIDAIWQSDPG